MNIIVVGLGLIGGSFCKSLKKNTFHTVWGIDKNEAVLKKALECGAIDEAVDETRLCEADLTIICLYPDAINEFVKNNADNFKKGSIVTDSCGVKKMIVDFCSPILKEKGVIFVGSHPMAGREFSGFEYSTDTLFENASYIITQTDDTPTIAINLLSALVSSIGFSNAVISTPEKHDQVIAYTSQLAHVVSNAYVKSPSLLDFNGFSAGSFLDLTRVAKLNENMWTNLFEANKDALLYEIDTLLDNLSKYRKALSEGQTETLRTLLKDGRELKEKSLEIYNKDKS